MLYLVKSLFCIYWDGHILYFVYVMYHLIYLHMLNHPCALEIKPTWSWYICIIVFGLLASDLGFLHLWWWKILVWDEGVSRVCFFWGLFWLVYGYLFPIYLCVCTCLVLISVCLLIPLFIKTPIILVRLEPVPMTSF